MDELGCSIRVSHKSRVVIPAEEKQVIKTIDGKREWATNINTISSVGTACKGFFVIKGIYVLRDLMKYIIKSGCICAVTPNEWSNHDMTMTYIKHFNKHTELIGEYRLLILDKHG